MSLVNYKVAFVAILFLLFATLSLQKYQNKELKKSNVELQERLKGVLNTNEKNSRFIEKLKKEHEKQLKIISKIDKSRINLQKEKVRLVKTIDSLKDENLSKIDREFIEKLYPQK